MTEKSEVRETWISYDIAAAEEALSVEPAQESGTFATLVKAFAEGNERFGTDGAETS